MSQSDLIVDASTARASAPSPRSKSGLLGAQRRVVRARGSATVTEKTANRKLAPVELVASGGRARPLPIHPYACTTNTSIAATCSCSCPFQNAGRYVQTAFTRFGAERLARTARVHTGEEVIAEEVRCIDESFRGGEVPQDGARGGRDLRLHVGGDVWSVYGAQMLAAAAVRWLRGGGGQPYAYTHWWRVVPRDAWGPVSVLACVETAADIERASDVGYLAAIAVDAFPSDRAFRLPGSSARIIPCPAETRGVTCATGRLCIDRDLLGVNAATAFAAHGSGKRRVVDSLLQIGQRRSAGVTHAGQEPR